MVNNMQCDCEHSACKLGGYHKIGCCTLTPMFKATAFGLVANLCTVCLELWLQKMIHDENIYIVKL